MKKTSVSILFLLGLFSLPLFAAEGNTVFQQKFAQAKTGDAKAQAYVGLRYDKGMDGVSKNQDEAIKWLTAAAWQDQMGAQAIAGMRYFARKDYAQAYFWLSLAASKGHTASQKNVQKVAEKLSSEQLAKLQEAIKNFKPKVVIPD